MSAIVFNGYCSGPHTDISAERSCQILNGVRETRYLRFIDWSIKSIVTYLYWEKLIG
uniref:Uncharacterized protein n=1 Tax=Octopus bimaculoides TaxID=37653 RepID=A0A0L8HPN8_OCTBM